jgi:predicted nucleic acid-binding protein
VILVDANVLMYAAGSDHPFKPLSTAFLTKVAAGDISAAIDAETLQEILHRYRSLHRWQDAERVYELARTIFPDVLAVTADVMDEARLILSRDKTLSARDAVHAAVSVVYSLDAICSFDSDFDRIPGCVRVPVS